MMLSTHMIQLTDRIMETTWQVATGKSNSSVSEMRYSLIEVLIQVLRMHGNVPCTVPVILGGYHPGWASDRL